MNIDIYTSALTKKDGIWYADKKAAVSFPQDGYDMCFQIEDNSFWFRHRNNCILELVKKYPPEGFFFDVGGGNGFVAKAVEDAGIKTVLVEPGEKGCINANKRMLGNVICSTLEDAGFQKNSIAAIGVFDVVEHCKDDKALLKSIFGFLQKDGLLFVTVPAYNFLWSNEDDEGGHFNRYTLTSLKKLLVDTGFKSEYSTYIFSILPIPILLFRTIPSKLGMNKNTEDIQKNTNEHKNKGSFLDKIWAWELGRIKRGKPIPFGGSCLIVARKNN